MYVLTFDIEEWFHLLDNDSTKSEKEWGGFETRIESNVDRILDLLSQKQKKATFFCLGWIAEKYPAVIKKISTAGHEIGSHSYSHQLVYEQSRNEFEEDLKKSIYTIENIIGSKVTLYRSPGFSITKDCFWAFNILLEYGIKCDCSIFPGPRSHGGVANFPYREPFRLRIDGSYLQELPMSLFHFGRLRIPFSGGGYFRLFPYSTIRHMATDAEYLMTYFHPRDFDPGQPVIPGLPITKKFKAYYGLSGAFEKLNRLTDDFDFITVGDAVRQINWDVVPVVDIDN